jgi:hypothetical protein
MKLLTSLWILVIITLLMTPLAVMAGNIKASATPSSNIAVIGQQITVPVIVDISRLQEKLGSYTAELTWDAHGLKYISSSAGSADGFTSPVVNATKTSQGKLIFAAANPYGAEGRLTILNVVFEVIGTTGSSCALDLRFTALAAAYTFNNLLPYVETLTGVAQGLQIKELPKEFALLQNYPNPFNPGTKINYQLPAAEQVSLGIYNVLGQKIRTLVNEFQQAGSYDVYWDGKDETGKAMPVGIYIYKLQAGDFSDMKKMQLVK